MNDQPVEDSWDADDTEEPEELERDELAYQISYYPSDFTLKGYLDKWESGQIVIPEFQRAYVWDQVKASKLIESFLLGLPVPGVFLYKERRSNKLLIIDGQQRIITAIRYLTNEFDEKIFRLKNVNKKWEGKTYQELDEADRFELNDSVLRATVIQQIDPRDDSSVYHIFERLNTGGVNLNPMEIRKCVSHGPLFHLLEELNAEDSWRKLIGKPKCDKRLRDVELVLRILALSENWDGYEKPMKGFLNNYMSNAKKLGGDEIGSFVEKHRVTFKKSCSFLLQQLGEKPFHLRGRLNYAVMDSTMAITIERYEDLVADFKGKFRQLLIDEDYVLSVTKSTSDEAVLTTRFLKAKEYLVG